MSPQNHANRQAARGRKVEKSPVALYGHNKSDCQVIAFSQNTCISTSDGLIFRVTLNRPAIRSCENLIFTIRANMRIFGE